MACTCGSDRTHQANEIEQGGKLDFDGPDGGWRLCLTQVMALYRYFCSANNDRKLPLYLVFTSEPTGGVVKIVGCGRSLASHVYPRKINLRKLCNRHSVKILLLEKFPLYGIILISITSQNLFFLCYRHTK